MSRKETEKEGREEEKRDASHVDKEKLSRVNKRHQKEARKKRRLLVVVLLILAAALAAGAIFDLPYINIAREAASWVGERFEGSGESEDTTPEYLYFTHPQSAREIVGEVSVLVGVYDEEILGRDGKEVLGLALFTYDTTECKGEVYLIPENAVAYDAEGQQTDLKRSLQEEGGSDLLRSTVNNLSGMDADYLLLLEFWEAVRLLQAMQPPSVTMQEQTVLVNPLNGETDFLVSGQQIKDADRLLFYLLATDEVEIWSAFSTRLLRAQEYVREFLAALGQQDVDVLQDTFSSLGEDYILDPGAGSPREDGDYLASMLQSFSELDESGLAIKAVPAVEVLNGCGIPDLGKKVGDRLGSLGVPVSGTGGNAKVVVDDEEVNDFSHQVSSVIYRSEDPRVKAFAEYLGVLLSIENVVSEPGPGQEIILIAGKDLAS